MATGAHCAGSGGLLRFPSGAVAAFCQTLASTTIPISRRTALELAAEPALGYMGPTDLPFDHDDVRVYIDNLFLEGYLKPYAAADHGLHLEHTDLPEWLRVGLHIDPEVDRMRRVEGLLASIAASVPSAEARHHDWLAFAHRWAELLAVWHQLSPAVQPPLTQRFQEVQEHVDYTFLA